MSGSVRESRELQGERQRERERERGESACDTHKRYTDRLKDS